MSPNPEILEKVKKLLALATSPVEAEAQLAMEKAGHLLAKHGLTIEDVQVAQEEGMTQLDVTVNGHRIGWTGWLANLVATTFDCRVLRVTGLGSKWVLTFRFIGVKGDAQLAEHTMIFLVRQVEILTAAFKKKYFPGRSGKWVGDEAAAYATGVVSTIEKRLKAMRKAQEEVMTAESMALVPVKTAMVDRWMTDHLNIRKGGGGRKELGSWQSYEKGLKDGEGIKLNKAIKER